MAKILSGTWKWKCLNGRRVRVLVPPKKPTITWGEVIELFKSTKKK